MPLLKSLLPGKGLGQGGAKLQERKEGRVQGGVWSQGRQDLAASKALYDL